jgi:hypothetical protein
MPDRRLSNRSLPTTVTLLNRAKAGLLTTVVVSKAPL